jgi:DNA-binding CsgD family transcriptional regulator
MTAMQNDEGELRRLALGEDGDVGYYDTGHGEAIVLVHAGVFSDWFRPLNHQLPRERFRVVRLRRAGYRGAASPGRHLGLADHAGHAARLLDTLGTGPAHWVGHSSSCLMGLQLAQDRPDLVASLSLLEPAPGGDLHGPADEQFVATTVRPAMEEFFAGDPGGAFDRFMRGIGGPGCPAVVTSQLGPGSLDTARAESAFFFADELPAVQEWVFGPSQAARVNQAALVVLAADSAAAPSRSPSGPARELRAAGGRPSQLLGTGARQLTVSERRVAALAAEGRSNPEIAQVLFVTRKTVETHLGHIYHKLGVPGRGQLGPRAGGADPHSRPLTSRTLPPPRGSGIGIRELPDAVGLAAGLRSAHG